MRIIPAQNRIADCIALRKEIFVAEQGVPVGLEVDAFDEPDSGCTHFLLLEPDEGGSPIGTFRAYFEDAETVHLQRFCIKKAFRGRGHGREALRFIEEYYRALGAKRITFGAQCAAIPFYEKCGYTCVSGVFDDAGIPHRRMEKEI